MADETVSQHARDVTSSPFSVFTDLKSLGHFKWEPSGPYKEVSALTASDFLERLTVNAKPPTARSLRILNFPLPRRFLPDLGERYRCRFPYDHTWLTPVVAAAKGGKVNISSLDFFLSGYALHFLADGAVLADLSKKQRPRFCACLVPGTEIIDVGWIWGYNINLRDSYNQTKGFITHGRFREENDHTEFGHLQQMTVNEQFRVLTVAGTSALNDKGEPVLVRSGQSKFWDSRLPFQMIAGGCAELYAGKKCRDGMLDTISSFSLLKIIGRYCPPAEVPRFEKKLSESLAQLKSFADQGKLEEGRASSEIVFTPSGLTLLPLDEPIVLFPSHEVVSSLLSL